MPGLARSLAIALATAALALACRHVPSPQEVQASRTRAFDQALARAQARFGGAPITVEQVIIDPGGWSQPMADEDLTPARPRPVRIDDRVAGQGEHDLLYRLPDGRLAVASPTCLQGGSCGCELAIDYRYLRRDDGRIAIVRMTPKVEVIEVKVEHCGYGCGQPPPPRPITAAALDVHEVSQLEVIDETYRYVDVRQVCDHPIPAP